MDLIAISYSFAVAAGGIFGYIKSGSVPSIAAGLAFGIVSGFGAYQVSKDPYNVHVLAGSSGILTGIMGARFYKTGKIMPPGVVAAMSLFIFLRYGSRLLTSGR